MLSSPDQQAQAAQGAFPAANATPNGGFPSAAHARAAGANVAHAKASDVAQGKVLTTARPPLPKLETYGQILMKRDEYVGPTDESNWVLPDRLLVGAYPASMNDEENDRWLGDVIKQGVTTFVCLQREYQNTGVTEAMWRSGNALRPYYQEAVPMLAKLQARAAADPHGGYERLAKELELVHFPIEDCNVGEDGEVLKLCENLAERVRNGECLYVHCWGGHGRTGTVVCIMLFLLYGLPPAEGMRRCQFVHDLRKIPIDVGSPQTQTQRNQVVRVIKKLVATRAAAPKKQAAGKVAAAPAPAGGAPSAGAAASGGAAAAPQTPGKANETVKATTTEVSVEAKVLTHEEKTILLARESTQSVVATLTPAAKSPPTLPSTAEPPPQPAAPAAPVSGAHPLVAASAPAPAAPGSPAGVSLPEVKDAAPAPSPAKVEAAAAAAQTPAHAAASPYVQPNIPSPWIQASPQQPGFVEPSPPTNPKPAAPVAAPGAAAAAAAAAAPGGGKIKFGNALGGPKAWYKGGAKKDGAKNKSRISMPTAQSMRAAIARKMRRQNRSPRNGGGGAAAPAPAAAPAGAGLAVAGKGAPVPRRPDGGAKAGTGGRRFKPATNA